MDSRKTIANPCVQSFTPTVYPRMPPYALPFGSDSRPFAPGDPESREKSRRLGRQQPTARSSPPPALPPTRLPPQRDAWRRPSTATGAMVPKPRPRPAKWIASSMPRGARIPHRGIPLDTPRLRLLLTSTALRINTEPETLSLSGGSPSLRDAIRSLLLFHTGAGLKASDAARLHQPSGGNDVSRLAVSGRVDS